MFISSLIPHTIWYCIILLYNLILISASNPSVPFLADVSLGEVASSPAPDDLLPNEDESEDVDSNEMSFVIKTKPKKIKIDSRLLSGFCLEAAVPLEEGRNEDTKGIIVGKRVGRNIEMTHIVIPNQDTECLRVASWVMDELKPWGNSTEIIGTIFTHISKEADVLGHDVFGLSVQDIHNHRSLVENFNDLSVSVVAGFSSSKEFLGIESYSLTRLGLEKVEVCNFEKSLYEPSTHTAFGEFDWDVEIIDQRNGTVIENPDNFITELGNVVAGNISEKLDESNDITNVSKDGQFEKGLENLLISEFDQSWSFVEAGNLRGNEIPSFSVAIPFSDTLLIDPMSSTVGSLMPATPVQRSAIQPVISPVPAMMDLETPASTPSIIVTPSSPTPQIEPTVVKAVEPVDKSISQEYKDQCANANNGKWTKSSKGFFIYERGG